MIILVMRYMCNWDILRETSSVLKEAAKLFVVTRLCNISSMPPRVFANLWKLNVIAAAITLCLNESK